MMEGALSLLVDLLFPCQQGFPLPAVGGFLMHAGICRGFQFPPQL